jgi:hypothetical protein
MYKYLYIRADRTKYLWELAPCWRAESASKCQYCTIGTLVYMFILQQDTGKCHLLHIP